MDLSRTIEPKSDQLNADDLIAGPRTITITKVVGHDSGEQPVSIFFEGDKGKPYKPGLSMRRVIVKVWGADSDTYTGRRMTLYQDPDVMFGGIRVGGIRISHMSHIDGPVAMPLTVKRGRKNEFTVEPLAADESEQVLIDARAAASEGTEAFVAFYNTPRAKEYRPFLKQHMSDLREIATNADEASKPLAQRMAESAPQDATAPEPPAESEAEGEAWQHDHDAVDPFSDAYKAGAEAFKADTPEADAPVDDYASWNNWIGGWRFEQGQAG